MGGAENLSPPSSQTKATLDSFAVNAMKLVDNIAALSDADKVRPPCPRPHNHVHPHPHAPPTRSLTQTIQSACLFLHRKRTLLTMGYLLCPTTLPNLIPFTWSSCVAWFSPPSSTQ